MTNVFRRISIFALALSFPASVFASASAVDDALGNLTGNAEVSRSVFLKAAVISLGVPVDFGTPDRRYRSYPEDIRAYVIAADTMGALDALGSSDMSQAITRGEAVRLIAELRTWKGTGAVLSFDDVPAGTELRTAVELAVQGRWMKPLRDHRFGVAAKLRAKEARTALTRASTDAGERPPVKIKIVSKRKDTVSFTSKKFRDQVKMLLQEEYLYADKLRTATGANALDFVESMKDPYTTLFDPAESKAFQDQLSGEVTGIGVQIDDKHLEVLAVIEGSPAERAGMKAGDRIVSVNKKRVVGTPLDQVIKRIRGAKGTPVRVGVERDGKEQSFDMIRAKIEVPDTKIETRNNVAIVKVSQFGDHLIKDAPGLFDTLVADGYDGIVIDLRGNPGGYLNAVPSIVGEFLPSGTVYLYTRSRTTKEEYVTNTDPSVPADVPLVILVNGNSASSAEIVAGALQDHDRATIVGTKTFGKGTVQTVYPFANKASLKFTIAEWLTPDEHPINDVGITPDEIVEPGDAGDPQLDRALEIISQSR